MYQKVFTSTTFLLSLGLIAAQLFLSLHGADGQLFALEDAPKWYELVLFNPSRLSIDRSPGLILSFFFHGSFSHFLINFIFFVLFAALVEKQWGRLKAFLLVLTTHLFTVITLKLYFMFQGLQHDLYYSGASAAIMGLIACYLQIHQRRVSLFVFIAVIVISNWNSSQLLLDPHLIGLCGGLMAFKINGLLRRSAS